MYQRLTAAVEELSDRLGGLPAPSEARAVWHDIWHLEAHNSTAIEGNTLALRQVRTLLDEGKAVGGKELREYMEVKGYADAAEWVYSQAIEPTYDHGQLVTVTELREVHRMAMTPVWDVAPHPEATAAEAPGGFRQHDIHPFPGGMVPPPHPSVAQEMTDWTAATCLLSDEDDVPLPERLAQTHARFEQIHPFLDGNGRAGRLTLNLLLVRLGYPPAIIFKPDRDRYLKALRAADSGTFGQLGELIARSVLDNLHRFVYPAVAGPARLVPLAALASPKVSATALRAAATRGRLQAQKGADGQWRTSQAWVDDYLVRRHERE
ncbi:Fic family protein [soil metagenome]